MQGSCAASASSTHDAFPPTFDPSHFAFRSGLTRLAITAGK